MKKCSGILLVNPFSCNVHFNGFCIIEVCFSAYFRYAFAASAVTSNACVCVTGRAGATASVNCSVCQAGTYGTGPGKGLSLRMGFDCEQSIRHSPFMCTSMVSAPSHLFLILGGLWFSM